VSILSLKPFALQLVSSSQLTVMFTLSFTVALAVQASFGVAFPLFERAVDFYNPSAHGGSLLDNAGKFSK